MTTKAPKSMREAQMVKVYRRFAEILTWGTTSDAWEEACEASTARSRARRVKARRRRRQRRVALVTFVCVLVVTAAIYLVLDKLVNVI